ncbi:guanylate kinase [Demequina oxidasica]|uniref:guanylate kinase n=1 Tax=Demequina oxidasica TaxID=676199 RepID=UPI000782551B|nr:guanylate kinase [Demequina oxidasica]
MNRLVVLAGPSGVGKGTVVRALRDRHPEVWLSVSATTRGPRPGEVDGQHYFFVGDDEFTRMVETGELLEWATVFGGNRYGTPRGPVEDRLSEGTPCILEIDLQGARQVRESMPEALQVFIAPPSFEVLVDRLVGRGTEDERERERRLATAREEIAAQGEFDEVIVNDNVMDAADALERLLLPSR